MRNKFDEQLELLNKELIEMGGLIEQAIQNACAALRSHDARRAKEAIKFDREIDEKERRIESLCLRLLLQQQPVARDLRLISAALKMITDMERIGDQAADISEIVLVMDERFDHIQPEEIPLMADATIAMVTNSIDAFVRRDEALAREVIDSDDEVDNRFIEVRAKLIERFTTDPRTAEYALDLFMITKYLERIGDHAVNIAEWVLFSITGVHKSSEIDEE
ncbi:MAG TPA: phosphate signaling complex protein PhoU [Feifaniaceae bacterium]|nr:phosphate signaling complex protein PhoU [Feifaniaceae bacterium]